MTYLEQRMMRKAGLAPKLEFKKPKKPIAKIGKKKMEEDAAAKLLGSDSEMDIFFAAMRKRMVGKCLFCSGKTEKDNDEMYRASIAHLFPKRPINQGGFPSIGTNENNWIELCHYNNSCHQNFDSGKITWEFIKDSKEWEIIKEKLYLLLPMIAETEKKHKLYSRIENLLYGKR